MKFSTTYKDFEIVFDRSNEKYIIYDIDGNVIKESKVEAEILKYLKETIYQMYSHTSGNVEKLNRTIWIIKMFKKLHTNLELLKYGLMESGTERKNIYLAYMPIPLKTEKRLIKK